MKNSKIVALKEMEIGNINLLRLVENEVVLMKSCESEFIVDIFNAFIVDNKAYVVIRFS